MDGDPSGEASDSDDELPEIVSRFLLLGEDETLGGKLGEAGRTLAQVLLRNGVFVV